MSEHLNVLYWLVQEHSANTALLLGNDGSIKDYFVCIVLLVKHPHLNLSLLL